MSFNQRSNARRLLTARSDRNGSPCMSAHTVKYREPIGKTEGGCLSRSPPFPRKVGHLKTSFPCQKPAKPSAGSAQLFSTFAGAVLRLLGFFLILGVTLR